MLFLNGLDDKKFTAEASPLVDLSIDGKENFELLLQPLVGKQFTRKTLLSIIEDFKKYPYPPVCFCLSLKKMGQQ